MMIFQFEMAHCEEKWEHNLLKFVALDNNVYGMPIIDVDKWAMSMEWKEKWRDIETKRNANSCQTAFASLISLSLLSGIMKCAIVH